MIVGDGVVVGEVGLGVGGVEFGEGALGATGVAGGEVAHELFFLVAHTRPELAELVINLLIQLVFRMHIVLLLCPVHLFIGSIRLLHKVTFTLLIYSLYI